MDVRAGTVDAGCTPPRYRSPTRPPSFAAALRHMLSDPGAVIPDTIYHDWAVKLPGPGFPLVLAHPASVRDVLLDKGETFGRERQLRRLMRRAWGDGLAAAEGEPWLRQRRAAAPAFRPQAVAAAADAMVAAARDVSARWPAGEPIELTAQAGRIVTRIVMATLLTGLDDVDLDAIAGDIPPLVREVTKFGLLDAAPLPDGVVNRLRGFGRSAQEARLRRLAARLAAAHARPGPSGQNLLALLREAGPLADNALGFMVAGFETTALGAAWALYLLALHPDWQEAVRAEAEAAPADGDRLAALPLARQVAQEALRLYPPAPFLVRAALRRTTLLGHRLWPHQAVLIDVYAIHRHRKLWDRPDAFDPDRFGPSGDYDRAAYLPFGAGPRLCIAASFATAEIMVILSELVRAYRFTPAGPEPEVSIRIGTFSTTGLHVGAERIGR